MDHVMTMIVAGKSFYVLSDGRGRKQVIGLAKIFTTTGAQIPDSQNRRRQFFLTLTGQQNK